MNGTIEYDGETDTMNKIRDNREVKDETMDIEEDVLKIDAKEVVEDDCIVEDKDQSLNEAKENETVIEGEKNNSSLKEIDVEEGSNSKKEVEIECDQGIKRRRMWNDLQIQKKIVGDRAWIMMGDMNVTLAPNEHSVGGSSMTSDMNDFKESVNSIEMEDIASSGLFFTYDILMFCNGDKDSVSVLKEAIEEFRSIYVLLPNYNKSIIIFESMAEEDKQEILECVPFKVEKLLCILEFLVFDLVLIPHSIGAYGCILGAYGCILGAYGCILGTKREAGI
uniref:RNA-directed DNA polymerase, eukaryota, reverse transcriptase zinc-binding domain protein n=1 Tax=Tanacetum cinerariifolium TaxID=118510 RepID=A0A6L2JBV0_TANCI|nr:RNA-directed DNA polymerase, eukaryota, reverse transcriptase zinc-binding domain protein [Tanacetum cinerariifolium]